MLYVNKISCALFLNPSSAWSKSPRMSRVGMIQRVRFTKLILILLFVGNIFPGSYLINTAAIGEGISYASSIPLRESKDSSTHNAKRLLNYLMFEVTTALPAYPEWELAVRIHHRSGAWGLYGAGNLSSNVIGLGVRYLF